MKCWYKKSPDTYIYIFFLFQSHKEPKASIQVSDLNMTFCQKKVGNPNGAQLTYVKDGSTRNIFIYSTNGIV